MSPFIKSGKKQSGRAEHGFTLVELMAVLAVSALLLSLAAPSFRRLLLDNEISSNVNEFIGAFEVARSEAVMRARLVTLCRSSNAESGESATCDAAATGIAPAPDWSPGWIVFVENSSSKHVGTRETGEAILLRKGVLPSGTRLMQTSASNSRHVTFNGMGEPTGSLTGMGFNFSHEGEFPRQICIARTGRLRLIKDAKTC